MYESESDSFHSQYCYTELILRISYSSVHGGDTWSDVLTIGRVVPVGALSVNCSTPAVPKQTNIMHEYQAEKIVLMSAVINGNSL